MKFTVIATIASLALANLAFAAPAASPAEADSLVQRSPNPDGDWKTKHGWDGKVTPCDKVGETIYDPEKPKTHSKRQLGGLYMCPAYDWGTQPGLGCTYTTLWNGQCIALNPATYRWTLSSVGPDPGTWCALYTSTNCQNGSPGFTNPGLSRLEGSTWGQYNDNTGSIKCWW